MAVNVFPYEEFLKNGGTLPSYFFILFFGFLMILFPVFPHHKFGVEANSIVSPKSYDKAGNDIDTCMNYRILENEIGDHFLDRLKQPFDYFP